MYTTIVFVVIGLSTFGLVTPLSLPNYIKPCQNGPKLNECVVKTTNIAIPKLIKGDPKYKVPVLDPLLVKEIKVSEDNKKSISMNVTLRDAKFHGLKNAKMVKSNFDLVKKHVEFTVTVPKITINSQYTVSGKFLILPITGNGPAKIDLDNVELVYSCDYKLDTIKGEEYIKLSKSDLKYETSKLQVDLKNLFNGDAALGKNMNEALNENWSELNNALGPSIAKAVGMAVTQIMDEITKTVPYKNVITQ